MRRMISKCILTTKETAVAAGLWLLLPASGIVWLYSIVGPDPRLLYLGAVTLLPAGLTLLAPWFRAWVEVRKELLELQPVRSQAQSLRQLQSDTLS